jgi:hypothetical protein
MSSQLAIASVTAMLRNLLDNAMVDDHVVNAVGNVKVSALAPDLIALAADAPSQLNLFLYHVTPNPGWRNVGLPSRDDRGDRRTNPPLALDLHYLLTAYASRELHAEILLGYGMQLLHETPGLSREAIRRGLNVPDLVQPSPDDSLPADLRAIATSELAEQVETIKITPEAMGAEEMSKLWGALQSKYRPSASYSVSVVLIEAKRPTRVPLPVRLPSVYVTPFSAPRIERVLSQETAGGPLLTGVPILAGQRLVLQGVQLKGERTLVRIGAATVLPDVATLRDSQIVVQLPADLPAGLLSAQVVHEQLLGEPPRPHTSVASNLAPFVLRPAILNAGATSGPPALHLDVEPPLAPAQQAIVFLNERSLPSSPPASQAPRAYSFSVPRRPPGSPPGPVTRIDVPVNGVAPGRYLVRLQVDGAESPVFADAQGNYDQPAVTLP